MIYDITSKITQEKPELKIGEKIYKINNSKDTMLKINMLYKENKSDIEMLDDVILLTLGEKAQEEIQEMQYTLKDYQAIFVAIMAGINGETYEETEGRFQSETK